MGSSSLAVKVVTPLTGALLLSIMNWTCLFLLCLTSLVAEALVLLDPNTGRTIELETPQGKQSPVFRMGLVRTTSDNNVQDSPTRRSDYISPSGVPLYKLRKRNPFGFGG